MLDYSETSENVYLAFNQHIGLTNKIIENLVHLTFKYNTTTDIWIIKILLLKKITT